MASKLWAFASLFWRSRWMGLVAGIWLLACSGNSYNFAIYSPALKSTLHYNQKEINGIGAAKDIGDNMGIVSGMLFDYLPIWLVLLIGATQTFVGYISLWLVASERVEPFPYWIVVAMTFMATNGNTWYNTATLVTCVRNFPRSRGYVVGMLKGFVGLSGAIFTQIYSSTYAPDQASFLYLVATTTASMGLLMMAVFSNIEEQPTYPESRQEESALFRLVLGSCVFLAVFLMVSILVQDLATSPVPRLENLLFTAGMMVILLLLLVAPLWTALEKLPMELDRIQTARQSDVERGTSPGRGRTERPEVTQPLLDPARIAKEDVREERKGKAPEVQPSSSTEPTLHVRIAPGASGATSRPGRLETATSPERSDTEDNYRNMDRQEALAVVEGAVVIKRRRKGPRRGENFTLTEAWVKADFWLLFLAVLCGSGSGLTAINNLAQMAQAQGYNSVGIFVSLISIWNFLGRLGAGIISEHYVRDYAVSRPWFILAAQGFMAVGHLLFASATPYSLHVGSLIVGLCYGAHWAIMPATVSELFGLQHFGSNYNFVAISIPTGSFLFSGLLAGYLYDIEAAKDHHPQPHPHPPPYNSTSSHPLNGILPNAPPSVIPSSNTPPPFRAPFVESAIKLRLVDFGQSEAATQAQSAQCAKCADLSLPDRRELRMHLSGDGGSPYTWGHFWRWFRHGGTTVQRLKPGVCRGAHCFRLTFIIMACVCFVGMMLAFVLIRRTRCVYEMLYKKPDESKEESKERKGVASP